jgi:hypothetical protein
MIATGLLCLYMRDALNAAALLGFGIGNLGWPFLWRKD